MRKTLLSLAAAALALASASASADFIPFTVNEGVVGTGSANPATPTNSFGANNMTGKYQEVLGLTSATSFSASAVGSIASYAVDGSIASSFLNIPEAFGGYKLYALFTATGNVTGPNQFEGTGGQLQVWIDRNSDTTTSITSFTSLATRGNDSDDIMVGSSTVSFGTGNLSGPPGAFNIYFKQFTLTAFGATYWTGIDTLQFLLQTNGDIDGVSPNPALNPPPYNLTGDFSANFALPEPGSILLVGTSLLGLGFASRRRQAK